MMRPMMTSLSRPNLSSVFQLLLPPLHAQSPPPPPARILPPSSKFAPPLLMHDPTGKKKAEEESKQAPSPGVSLYLCNGVTDVALASPGAIFAGTWEMGSCVSAQRSSSLESAVTRSLSSASRMEKPAVALPLTAAREVPVAAAGTVLGVPLGSRRTLTFSDFGSKEDNFFDSQAWMESDFEDEFFSVKGDFTPSRGNTPVHDSFFTSTPQRITTFFKDETLGSIPKPTPAGGKKNLAELFQESFRGGQRVNDDNKFSNKPTNPAWGISSASGANSVHSSKRTAGGGSPIVEEKHVTPFQDCLLSLVSCGSSSKRRRKMNPAIAIHG